MRAQVDSVCTGFGRQVQILINGENVWQFKVHPVAVARFRLGV